MSALIAELTTAIANTRLNVDADRSLSHAYQYKFSVDGMFSPEDDAAYRIVALRLKRNMKQYIKLGRWKAMMTTWNHDWLGNETLDEFDTMQHEFNRSGRIKCSGRIVR